MAKTVSVCVEFETFDATYVLPDQEVSVQLAEFYGGIEFP